MRDLKKSNSSNLETTLFPKIWIDYDAKYK